MTPLPGALGGKELVAWRLDQANFEAVWDSGEGAFLFGGRWNSPGVRMVYASIDAATAILEVAVHKGFRTLDRVPHVLTSFRIEKPTTVHVVPPEQVPDPAWLRPGIPSTGQQAFGDGLVGRHDFVLLPSAVSSHSWNLIFDATRAKGLYTLALQERFTLDPRLAFSAGA